MKNIKLLWYSLFIFLFSLPAIAQDNRQRIAVFDPITNFSSSQKRNPISNVFDTMPQGPNIDAGTKIAIREIISSTVVNIGKHNIVERSLLEKVIEEQSFSNSGIVDENQATEIGKLAGANKIIVSIVTTTGGRYMLSIKLIDVKTASVEKQQVKVITSVEQLLNVIEPMTYKLINSNVIKAEKKDLDPPTSQQSSNNIEENNKNTNKTEIDNPNNKILEQKKKELNKKKKQEKGAGYRGFIDFGGGFGLVDYGGSIVSLSTSHGYKFNPYFFLGCGASLDYHPYWLEIYLPIYLESRVNFTKKAISPYIGAKIGYSVYNMNGTYVNISFGTSFKIKNNFALNASFGYNMQMGDTEAKYNSNTILHKPMSGLFIKAGIEF